MGGRGRRFELARVQRGCRVQGARCWWVGCLQRGCEKTARWGRSDAERGCGQAPPTRERGYGREGRGARRLHCEPVWPIAACLEALCLLGWAFAFVGRQRYKSTVRRRARQHLLMAAPPRKLLPIKRPTAQDNSPHCKISSSPTSLLMVFHLISSSSRHCRLAVVHDTFVYCAVPALNTVTVGANSKHGQRVLWQS